MKTQEKTFSGFIQSQINQMGQAKHSIPFIKTNTLIKSDFLCINDLLIER